MKSSFRLLAFLSLAASVHASTVTWDAANANNNWNTTDLNWTGAVAFANGNDALFNAASGESVSVDAGGVNPASTTVSAGSWTFTGGSIGGTLAKSGTGTLTLSASNGFTGTTISGGPNSAASGAIQVGAAGVFGTGAITLGNTGTMTALFFQSGFGSNSLSNNIAFASGAVQTNLLATGSVNQTVTLDGILSGGNSSATIYLNNTVAGGVAKFKVTNTGNTVLGKWQLNRGALEITSDAALGDAANDITLDVGNTAAGLGLTFGANSISTGSGRSIAVLSSTSIDTGTFTGSTILGQITGTAALTRRGTTSLVPANNTNTQSGGWIIATAPAGGSAQGSLHVTAASLNASNIFSGLGTGAITATSTGTILSSAVTGTASNNIVLPNTATRHDFLATNATELTLSGVISGGGANNPTFYINTNQGGGSTGYIKLTNTNTFTGKVQINRGGLAIASDAALGNAANSLTIDIGTATQIGLRFDTAITSSRNIQLGASKQVLDTNGNNVSLAGIISGSGDLFKASAGKLTLTGTNTYSGSTTVNAGTLEIGAGSTTGTIGTGAVVNNGAISFNRSNALTIPGAFSGAGSLSQDGSGTTTLNGSLPSASPLTINSGTFAFGTVSSAVTTGTLSSITQNNGSLAIDVDGATTDVLTVTNAYQYTNGNIVLNILNAPTNGVTYPIINYGTLSGAPPVTMNGLTGSRLAATVDYGTGTASSISVTFSGVVADLIWSGSISNTWDLETTNNWKNSGTPDSFHSLDNIVFNDSPTSGNTSPVLDFTATAGSITFSNTAKTYTITGAGGLAGVTGVKLDGDGTVILATNNSYSGFTDILGASTLQIGNGGTAGTLGTGGTYIEGSLIFNRSDDSSTSSILSGTGTVTKQGSGVLSFTGTNTYNGPTTINAGTLQIGDGGTTGTLGSGSVTDNATLSINRSDSITISNTISGTGALSKSGAGILTLTGTNTYANGTTIKAGNINLGNVAALGSGPITVETGASTGTTTTAMLVANSLTTNPNITNAINLPNDTVASNRGIYMYGIGNTANTLELSGKISGGSSFTTLFLNNDQVSSTNPQVILSNNSNDFRASILINRGGLRISSNEALGQAANIVTFNSNAGADLTWSNAMDYSHDTALLTATDFDTGANTITASGIISGTAGFTKIGAGTLILSSANTFTGTVNINAGTLQVDGSITTSANILSVSATGTLTGIGTINRPTTVDGTIAPGAGVGTLTMGAATINGSYACDVNGSTSDVIATTNLTLGAASTLAITDSAGTFPRVIATYSGTLSGTFATVPSGYQVDYTTPDQIILSKGSNYSNWATAKGLTGADAAFNADPDGDGIVNGLEFVLGGEPNPANSGSNSTSLLPTLTTSGGNMVFTYHLADAAAYLNPVVEFDTDLVGPWTTAVQPGNATINVTDGSPLDTITVTIPTGGSTRMFARLKAIEVP